MTATGTEGLTFTAPEDRVGRFGELCLRYLPTDRPLRVLDLGCGTGAQIFYLLERLPLARFVGLDISAQSIAAARAEAERRGDERVSFVAADYLDWDPEPFDAVLSDSVLQTIPVSDERLYRKLERDLGAGGLLLLSLPYDGVYNRGLWGFRRLMRPLRGAFLESLVLRAARLIHPGWPEYMLRERIPYLFMLPVRCDGPKMRAALVEGCGLALEAERALPQDSPAKARHRLIVYRKGA